MTILQFYFLKSFCPATLFKKSHMFFDFHMQKSTILRLSYFVTLFEPNFRKVSKRKILKEKFEDRDFRSTR